MQVTAFELASNDNVRAYLFGEAIKFIAAKNGVSVEMTCEAYRQGVKNVVEGVAKLVVAGLQGLEEGLRNA